MTFDPSCTSDLVDEPGRGAALTTSALAALRDGLASVDPDQAVRWFHLRRNAYFDSTVWESLPAEQRLVVLGHVVVAASPATRLLSHCSAAAVWGIPLIGVWPDKVEILVPDNTHGVSTGIKRRRTQNLPNGTMVNGLLVTSAARTAVDLARIGSLATGVAAVDHVLHRHLTDRAALHSEIASIPRNGRGRRRARLAVALARPGSESPAESLSRTRLFELDLPQPRLQVDFEDGEGFIGRVDMYWDHLDLIGEVDGRLKYGVAPGSSPRQAGDVVWREKLREDRLRAVTSRLTRWTWDDAISTERFRRKLTAAGLRATGDPTWLELL